MELLIASQVDIGLDCLTPGRAALYRAILEQLTTQTSQLETEQARVYLTAAVDGFRRAGQQQYIPHGSLSRDKESLAKAAQLIKQCGYWRRKEELADAEEAAKQW